eukprot:GHRQ01020445.1.p2 GENE.GHRQ01020445.1~~GHRQ01020445.1.p2  ORF type:complete len:130 (+),score=26.81 GHRQ01020445.1:357-746(+)
MCRRHGCSTPRCWAAAKAGHQHAGRTSRCLDTRQIVAHQVDGYNADAACNQVDGDPVPVPHFGAALSVAQFQQLAERVREAGVSFVIEPHVRFQGQPGEQVRLGTQHAATAGAAPANEADQPRYSLGCT